MTISWTGLVGKPQGTIKYVADYSVYPGGEQTGHYFPIAFDPEYYGKEILVGSQNGAGGKTIKPTAEDPYLIIRVENVTVENKISAVVKNAQEEIFTLDFSGATLAAPLGKDAFNADKTDYGGFGNNEAYYKNSSVEIAWDGTKATVTGELNWLDESARGQFSKLSSNGNYFAFSLIEWFKGKEITVDNSGKVSTASDTDWVCLVSEGKKTITVKCGETTIATYDLSGVTLASGEP